MNLFNVSVIVFSVVVLVVFVQDLGEVVDQIVVIGIYLYIDQVNVLCMLILIVDVLQSLMIVIVD